MKIVNVRTGAAVGLVVAVTVGAILAHRAPAQEGDATAVVDQGAEAALEAVESDPIPVGDDGSTLTLVSKGVSEYEYKRPNGDVWSVSVRDPYSEIKISNPDGGTYDFLTPAPIDTAAAMRAKAIEAMQVADILDALIPEAFRGDPEGARPVGLPE